MQHYQQQKNSSHIRKSLTNLHTSKKNKLHTRIHAQKEYFHIYTFIYFFFGISYFMYSIFYLVFLPISIC